jgi:prolyl-tRNA editing enzyme YbaK/EbsC (Cys-tRNA(Pro) deacylase)/2-polyprenyl-3-methyl-5-hydroxy-6-metoxy-1,4-benzoquinol methylase
MSEIDKQLFNIKPSDVCAVLRRKFEAERMHRFFSLDDKFSFSSQDFELTAENSMLLRFRGLDLAHPYNMLLMFSLADTTTFSFSLQNQIRRVVGNNIDKVVIWTKQPVEADAIHSLKLCNANIICVTKAEMESVRFISHFYPYGRDYNYAVVLNKLTDLLVIRLKKLFHLVLSEIAAPTYDTDYGSNKVGTKAIMDFEEEILERTIKHLSWDKRSEEGVLEIAVDVGCGTGRHSLVVMSPHFKNVFGFDFSPKMIEIANKKKREQEAAHVVFTTADLEYEQIAYEEEFSGSADLVVASFGMGSFIEDTDRMLRRFHEWLRPGGMLFISMYNRNSVLLNLTPNWRDTSLSAHINVDSNTLQVQLGTDTIFQIFCKPFDDCVKAEIAKKFNVLNIYSYPTTLALLPNTLLQEPLAKNLFTHVDRELSSDKDFFLGHYVLLIAQKPRESAIDGYKNVMMALENAKAKPEFLKHDMVLSIADVLREIGEQEGVLVKTLIFHRADTERFLVVALRHDRQLNKNRFAKHISVHYKKLRFAIEKQVVALGFPLGGIPPFGYPDTENIEFYIDQGLTKLKGGSVFMGVGDNRQTLKLTADDFHKLIAEYRIIPETVLQHHEESENDSSGFDHFSGSF